MAVVILADVMDLLDATIANLAGPSIRREMSAAGETTLQWILAAYTLTFAVGPDHLGPGSATWSAAAGCS